MSDRYSRYVLVLLLVALVGGGVIKMWGGGSEPIVLQNTEARPPAGGDTGVTEQDGREVAVQVTGAVSSPGVYFLPKGARVLDAVNEAEPLPAADLNRLALAQKISDGQTIDVPRIGDGAKPAAQGGGSVVQGSKININTATEEQLQSLPGIGPVYAQRIIEYRQEHGPFTEVEKILEVPGIGEKRYAQIKERITI